MPATYRAQYKSVDKLYFVTRRRNMCSGGEPAAKYPKSDQTLAKIFFAALRAAVDGCPPTAAQKKARPDKYGEGSEEFQP